MYHHPNSDGGVAMIIREHYIDVIEAIAAQAGIKRAYPADYRVSARATRVACLRYTLRYVVRHRRQHYRYNQYRSLLTWALRGGPDFGKDGPLLHFDLGCGPGLFAWVVRDVFLGQRISVEHYGYDHSRAMVELASEIWNQLSVDEIASWHDRPGDLLAAALAAGPRLAVRSSLWDTYSPKHTTKLASSRISLTSSLSPPR